MTGSVIARAATAMVLASFVGALTLGCEPPVNKQRRAAPAPKAAPVAPVEAKKVERPSYPEDAFVERGTENRDPFRSYARFFTVRLAAASPQRHVTMPNTAISDARLIAIISGTNVPRAMLVDREGVGFTIRRGDYVGRAEVVQTGGTDSIPVTLNWRVDQIRPDEVVLSREDPTNPDRAPVTQVIPLNDKAKASARR